MNYYLPEQCLALDRISQKQFGMAEDVLMENAGRSVASAIMNRFKEDLKSQPVTVVCGPGNNGGDGLVIARLFANQGIQAHVIHVLPKGQDPKSEASRIHMALLKKQKVPYRTVAIGDEQGFIEALGQEPGICIDALFGVGAREPFESFWLNVFQLINQSVVFSVSVDHPSGYATRDGADVGHPFIKARLTCSIGLPKFAQYTHAGSEASGEIVMCDAGFPQAAVEQMKPYATGIQFDYVLNHFKRPTEHAHKNQMGHVGFYAGSQQMPGALNMCVLGAQQSGVGKLTVFGLQSDIETFQRVLPPEVMYATPKNAEQFCDMVQQKRLQTLVVGPGLALPSEQVKSILWAASKLNVRLILDAEVFRHMTATEVKQNFPTTSNVVWIGHLGEQQLFFERPSVTDMFEQSLSLYKDWLKTFPNHVWLRKGHGSVLMSQNGLMLNESGNVGLAKGGSGDVLAGILGAFTARDVALDVSTASAVWVHGRAADLVLAKTGNPLSVTPSDCIKEIAQVLKEIYHEPPKPTP